MNGPDKPGSGAGKDADADLLETLRAQNRAGCCPLRPGAAGRSGSRWWERTSPGETLRVLDALIEQESHLERRVRMQYLRRTFVDSVEPDPVGALIVLPDAVARLVFEMTAGGAPAQVAALPALARAWWQIVGAAYTQSRAA